MDTPSSQPPLNSYHPPNRLIINGYTRISDRSLKAVTSHKSLIGKDLRCLFYYY